LTLAWDSGARPTVVLTKADLAQAQVLTELLAQVDLVAFGTECVATSAISGLGLDRVRALVEPGQVAILLGSSGVGKSSLLNALVGAELQPVSPVRASDGRGRHTTTTRRLVELPWGAYLVDTPGLREVQLWGDEGSLANSFPDVAAFAEACRFNDCSHDSEPGCAVQQAVADGDITEDRLASWHQLRRELAYLARRTDPAAARAERQKWKAIARAQRALNRNRPE
jgi:ribosome biogenesis GTPase